MLRAPEFVFFETRCLRPISVVTCSCICAGKSTVAVKIVRTVFGAEPLALREGLVQSSISSPLLPKCFDYGISNGLVYIVEEVVEGGISLDKVLEDEGPFSPLEAAEVGLQIAAALNVIHTAGFVHRDVKPQNVLRTKHLDGTYQYRLIDFGSAIGAGGCLFGGIEVITFILFINQIFIACMICVIVVCVNMAISLRALCCMHTYVHTYIHTHYKYTNIRTYIQTYKRIHTGHLQCRSASSAHSTTSESSFPESV